jgi:hypothetical protein
MCFTAKLPKILKLWAKVHSTYGECTNFFYILYNEEEPVRTKNITPAILEFPKKLDVCIGELKRFYKSFSVVSYARFIRTPVETF